MARAATSQELDHFRSSGQWSRIRAAIYSPSTVYSGRVNQVFSSYDKLLEITYDGGSGTLSDVLADMTVFFGSTAGAWDKGIARIRSIDGSKVYIGETSDLTVVNDDYITIVDDFSLWARPILISAGVPYIDGGTAYSDQHTNWTPVARMGPNRVVRKTGATVSASFDFSGSFAQGSSISGYLTTAPGSSAITGATTATPSVEWNSVGWKKVYLTITAANGKSSFGVRYVFVWDETNEPESVLLNSLRGSVESGGWETSITLFDNASLSLVRDHARVMLFAEDHFGPWNAASALEIGPVSGAENILFDGWIARESIDWDSEGGSVSFTAYSAHYWLAKIPAWPFGVEFTTAAPSAWTQIQSLTVDLGLLDLFLHASTAPRVMDIFLSGDTRLSKEVGSLASNLWGQMTEIAFDQIYARPLVNCLNQLYVEIHPQLVASGSRSWPTIFEILPEDIERPIDIERSTMDELSLLDLSGISINASGGALSYFSLAPGHSYGRYGDPEVQPKRLLSSQSQSNTQAGLYRSWRNNPYKSISIPLAGNNRLVDIAPRQKCTITITEGMTKRGISYTGGLIPTSIERAHRLESGFLKSTIAFEGETIEGRSTNGDVPGSINISLPPTPPLPPLPPLGTILPGTTEPSASGPTQVLLVDISLGILRTENFDAASPTWQFWNAGIDPADVTYISASRGIHLFMCPNGSVYVAITERIDGQNFDIVYRAPNVGGTFVKIIDQTWLDSNEGAGSRIHGIGYNPLVSEQVALTIGTGTTAHFWLGANTSWTQKVAFGTGTNYAGRLSYGFGNWAFDNRNGSNTAGTVKRFSGDGSALLSTSSSSGAGYHSRAGTTQKIFRFAAASLIYSIDNGVNFISIPVAEGFNSTNFGLSPDGTQLMANWDTGSRGKSPDGGFSWSGLPNLSFGGEYVFEYAGGSGVSSRWIAARGTVQYTSNFGDTWGSKQGNIASLIPVGMVITAIRVLEF